MGKICQINTHHVAKSDRLDYWNNTVANIFEGMVIDSDADLFAAKLLFVNIGRLGFMRAHSSKAVVRRSIDKASSNDHSLIMHLQNSGASLNRQDNKESFLRTGDFTFCDSSSRYSIDLSPDNDMLVVDIPFELITERLPQARDKLLKPISGACPQVRVLTTFLLTLWQECENSEHPNAWVSGMENVVLDLLEQALKAETRQAAPKSACLLQRKLIDCIHSRLSDPDLSTATMAAATGVSVRTVQSTFSRLGTTPTAFILERRLAMAAEWLRVRPDMRITDVAYDAGFSDSAYFTRRFRQRYGQSPRAYRAGEVYTQRI